MEALEVGVDVVWPLFYNAHQYDVPFLMMTIVWQEKSQRCWPAKTIEQKLTWWQTVDSYN